MRHPVSPSTATRCGVALGNGSARPAIAARATPADIAFSQVSTGNEDGFEADGADRVGRCGTVPARARTFIDCAAPSSSIVGHSEADVIARATGTPSGPSTTNV